MKSGILGGLMFAAVLAIAAGASSARAATPVPCSEIADLRALAPSLVYITNPSTGDQVDYVVIGDGAASSEVLLLFNGTGQILPDWPLQMITNSTYSPRIVHTLGYKRSQDGPVSLCHNYRMVLFDYPGVGRNSLRGRQVTKDMIASDADAILQDATTRYGISTDVVDPVGWSLGTTDALKYSLLSPVARPSRTIHNILLIATDPGGYTTGEPSPNEAPCVDTLFEALKTADNFQLKFRLSGASLKLTFPYAGQTARNSGTNSGCTATIKGNNVSLSVVPDCTSANNCTPLIRISLLNRLTFPWIITRGVGHQVYLQQRAQGNDWGVDYCSSAGPGFTSIDCHNYGPILQSDTNGGICKTDTTRLNFPIAERCVHFDMTGKILVLNGREDLFVQFTYGKTFVDEYNRENGDGAAIRMTYPGAAGHGILFQHPLWTQENIQAVFAAE